ncbi:telomerase RNA component interacting RNase [Bufo bufo]|uniref:telomerase RNA component interacting RNase n=1 Tax=Bufo bufo TaxID=8384 RepID=UPI001ABEC4B5|nr:telomerase RNA component interacting RNase [Bufo bufo]
MAEKSPRPEEEEEDGDEEGEEAAEAPARPVRVVTVKAEEPGEEATAPDSPPPPPPGEVEEAPLLASPPSSPNPQPAVPDPAAYPADHPSVSGVNLFANDGSFLELFKKKMEAGSKEESKEPDTRKPVILVGKRRGGAKLALKTGIVAKKPKTEDEEILTHKGGAWAQYMAEVKKYKAHQCSDDDKTRPLVK